MVVKISKIVILVIIRKSILVFGDISFSKRKKNIITTGFQIPYFYLKKKVFKVSLYCSVTLRVGMALLTCPLSMISCQWYKLVEENNVPFFFCASLKKSFESMQVTMFHNLLNLSMIGTKTRPAHISTLKVSW